MKTSSLLVVGLALAIWSNAPANADKHTKDEDTSKCSTTTWPNASAHRCTKPYATNYVECAKMVTNSGGRSSDAWWWCSNQGFKN
jgi:hypothetical protein